MDVSTASLLTEMTSSYDQKQDTGFLVVTWNAKKGMVETGTMVVDEDRVDALTYAIQHDSTQSRDKDAHETTEDVLKGTDAVSVEDNVNNPTEETEFGNSTEKGSGATYAEFDFVIVAQSLSNSQVGTHFIDSTKG
jgi:hypothetical protein